MKIDYKKENRKNKDTLRRSFNVKIKNDGMPYVAPTTVKAPSFTQALRNAKGYQDYLNNKYKNLSP